MISKPLWKQSVKANGWLWLVATVVVAIIIAILKIVMATSSATTFNVDAEQLAPFIIALWKNGLTIGGLTSALGLSEDFLQRMQGMDLNVVMNNLFYNLAGVLVPMIYAVIVANNLMASQVDKGSMSFVLSSSIKRSTVSWTQTVFLVSSLGAMFVVSAATDLLVTVASGLELQVGVILLLNLGLFFVMFAVGGLCFMFACIFNLSKQSYACGGGLCVMFYINKVLGMFGDPNFVNAGMGFKQMKIFDYFTLVTLLDTTSVCALDASFVWKYAILVVVGAVSFAVGNVVFVRKDLPL